MKVLTHVVGDLLTHPDVQIIGHQANCQNTFGSGIARSIREIYPEAYFADTTASREGVDVIGNISVAEINRPDVSNVRYIFNLYGQNLGTDHSKMYDRKTNYEGLYSALEKMHNLCSRDAANYTVGFPYKMGSDRGGGRWEIVERLIEVAFDGYNGNILIVHYNK